MTFILVWIAYALLGGSIFAAGFVWAVRQRQFTDLNSAHHIALHAAEPMEPDSIQSARPHKADIAGVAGILLIALAAIVFVLWAGWRCS